MKKHWYAYERDGIQRGWVHRFETEAKRDAYVTLNKFTAEPLPASDVRVRWAKGSAKFFGFPAYVMRTEMRTPSSYEASLTRRSA